MTDHASPVPPPTPDLADTEWRTIDGRNVLDYDADTGTYRASFDSRTEGLDKTIVAVVAAVSETPPLELPPLETVVDTSSVEQLVESAATDPSRADIHVSFSFADCDVTVRSYGIIAVQPLHEEPTD